MSDVQGPRYFVDDGSQNGAGQCPPCPPGHECSYCAYADSPGACRPTKTACDDKRQYVQDSACTACEFGH